MPSPANNHARRGSVANLAAVMGPQGTEALDSLMKVSNKLEDQLDKFTRPIRPWLPGLGRFLIVVTFFEDTLRILSQITGQLTALINPSQQITDVFQIINRTKLLPSGMASY